MSKILIELYDADAVENIISLETGRYDLLIFLCFKDSDPDQKKRAIMRSVILGRTGTEVLFEEADEKNTGSAKDALLSLAARYPDAQFVVDLTGGDEVLVAAFGFFMAGYGGNNFTAHRIDIRSGTKQYSAGERKEYDADAFTPVYFTFSDIIRLYGGCVTGAFPEEFGSVAEKKRYEILRIWNAVKDMASDWNRFCSIPYVSGIGADESGTVSRKFSKPNDVTTAQRVMSRLKKRGIVKSYEMTDNSLKYRFQPSAETEELYVSSGVALEMYTALAASGTGLFRECYTRVLLDVDGTVSKQGSDPTNELDVTLMYGFIPVFISCKNTEITKEYLYEIKTLAEHFGGRYALPMIVSTKSAFQPVRERAKEMHIMMIDDVQSLSLKEYRAAISKTVRGRQTD